MKFRTMKNLRKRISPSVDRLENRTVMAASFGFTAVGATLFYDIAGDADVNQILVGKNVAGDAIFQASTDSDGDGTFTPDEIDASGTVTAGDISLARLITGTTSFGGFRLSGLDSDDILDASGAGLALTPLQYAASLSGGNGIDTLVGGNGGDTLNGDAGNDTLTGGNGIDALFGGAGNDTLNADRRDTFAGGNGGIGNDVLNIANAPAGPAIFVVINTDIETINGDSGADRFDNSGFSDTSTAVLGVVNVVVNGGAGDDTIVSGPATIGAVTLRENLIGGAGLDTISYAASNAAVTVNLNNSTASGGFADGDTISLFENAIGSIFDDILTGSALANVLSGGAGNDTINGLGGDDTIDAGAGDDVVSGGAGNDTIVGGLGDDLLNGDGGNDNISGNDGNDELHGGGADDVLDGGAGVNALFGEGGNDTITISWTEILALVTTGGASQTGSQYFGNVGADIFRVVGTPPAVSAATFQNVLDDYFKLQVVLFGLSDFALPDTIVRA